MKVELNNTIYKLVKSGVSDLGDKLIFTIIRDENTYEDIKTNATGNSKIKVLDDTENFMKMYKDFSELVSATQKENYIITSAKYDSEGEIVTEEEKGTVVVITLRQTESEDESEEETEESVDVKELEAKIEYLLMMLE